MTKLAEPLFEIYIRLPQNGRMWRLQFPNFLEIPVEKIVDMVSIDADSMFFSNEEDCT